MLLIFRVDVRAVELLLQELLLGKAVYRIELGVGAPEGTLAAVLRRALADPLVKAPRAEGRLTLYALAWLQDDLQTNLADEKRIQLTITCVVRADCVPRTEVGRSEHRTRQTVLLLNKYQVTSRETGPVSLSIHVHLMNNVLRDDLLGNFLLFSLVIRASEGLLHIGMSPLN